MLFKRAYSWLLRRSWTFRRAAPYKRCRYPHWQVKRMSVDIGYQCVHCQILNILLSWMDDIHVTTLPVYPVLGQPRRSYAGLHAWLHTVVYSLTFNNNCHHIGQPVSAGAPFKDCEILFYCPHGLDDSSCSIQMGRKMLDFFSVVLPSYTVSILYYCTTCLLHVLSYHRLTHAGHGVIRMSMIASKCRTSLLNLSLFFFLHFLVLCSVI